MANSPIYYFIGIKGTGMAALAMILHDMGQEVEGSDISKHTFTQGPLEAADIPIYDFSKANLKPGMIVIAGNAFDDDQVEIKQAKAMNLEFYRYHEYVGKLMANYTSIGVAGTHGKTSTTGLLAHVLGGVAKTAYLIGDGMGKGDADARFFVFEADEYRRHFLAYHPDYLIMTNIDFDHPDYYKDINDVVAAFQTEANQVKKALFIWGDDAHLQQLTAKVPIYTYGTKTTDDFQAVNIKRGVNGSEFDVLHHGKNIGHYQIPLFGEHNILNSLAVVGVSFLEKISAQELAAEFLTYKGAKRRFAEKDIADMTIIDDYAHHPSEINATLDAARQKFPDKQIIAVFQPHTYSRLKALLSGFVQSLNKADKVYLTDIFGSIREHSGNISINDLADKLDNGGDVLKVDDMSPLLQYHNAVVVFMGAGDIPKYEVAYENLLQGKKSV
ncbi:UDP-N-acetylmuramate--L-alanine ligase [Agrilactobacillus composti DSM 18527 = JCM 14202]|uniref:UDP-N-acetylmuramate--L-alanine ligase n=1 Tax=Agrilactobacillus composti DSM 18527 = JCM 14202 TaxID=1423734 RepID=X0PE07_9LACO|nr:UDP-N-acetylmuramate--L-alanine ligase [Agrilactobacillus composti]KRM35772.1 UDP-N-acetylmuramate--L-alanine ligase [Agrilactobacillus composti DSM 18527 = JCM 14202]GAF39634.1 UDP-N-acetylmuramate-alanine ligase [Agrilactobacillus composti DSM 18527 = JCM 14202]